MKSAKNETILIVDSVKTNFEQLVLFFIFYWPQKLKIYSLPDPAAYYTRSSLLHFYTKYCDEWAENLDESLTTYNISNRNNEYNNYCKYISLLRSHWTRFFLSNYHQNNNSRRWAPSRHNYRDKIIISLNRVCSGGIYYNKIFCR